MYNYLRVNDMFETFLPVLLQNSENFEKVSIKNIEYFA